MYMGTSVSCAMECLTQTGDVPRVCLCSMLLNFNIWAMAGASGVMSAIWSLMLGPSRIMLTGLAAVKEQIPFGILLGIH